MIQKPICLLLLISLCTLPMAQDAAPGAALQKYSPGSETKRAVTTVAGATKLNVKSQLCTADGQVVMERIVNGNVRFLGGNLRATHNLAHNVAAEIQKSNLPEPKGP